MNRNQGFTLVEILVSLAIFGIFSLFLFSTFTSSVGLTTQAQNQVKSASQAQQILESVRSAWSVSGSGSNYDKACVPNFTLPTGYTAQFINLNSRALPVNASNTVVTSPTATNPAPSTIVFASTATCTGTAAPTPTTPLLVTPSGGTAQPPAMRRITVSSGTGAQDTTLTVDVLDPQ